MSVAGFDLSDFDCTWGRAMSEVEIVGFSFLVLLLLVFSSIPISVALMISSIGAVTLLANFNVSISLLSSATYNGLNSYLFAVVPLFVLMGAFMSRSRIASDLYHFLNVVLSWLRGGLGVATVAGNAIFAAVTGSSLASAAVFTKVSLPQMEKYRYSRRLALGAVAGSSVLGMLIPPSILMIVYGIISQVSIGALFIAGIVPGIMLAIMFSIYIIGIGFVRPECVGIVADSSTTDDIDTPSLADAIGTGPAKGNTSFLEAAVRTIPIIMLLMLVLGGIWGGLFSPMEAAAVGAVGAFVVGKALGMSWTDVGAAIYDSVLTSGSLMILIAGATLYSRMLGLSGVVSDLGNYMAAADVGQLTLIIICIAVALVLGTVLDSVSILILTVPVILPSVVQLGIDPLWFGIVYIVAVEVGLLTPPFGMIPFTMSAILGKSVNVSDIFIGCIPFIFAMFIAIAAMICFPALVTWLPGLMR
jgi:tripartite ATP-independent transporter DctM subunit